MKHSTSPDSAYLYLTSENDARDRVGFLPIGSLECHGSSLPLGTDLLIACAFAAAFARRVSGVVFPAIPYGYCPNTAALSGTISPRADVFLPYLMEVCRQVQRMCERLTVINIHRGNDAPIALVIDELFQSEQIAIYYLNPYTFLGETSDAKLFPGRDNSYKEAALLFAALRVLEDPHVGMYAGACDEIGVRPAELSFLRKHGKLGFSYPSQAAHVAERKDADVQAGLNFFEIATEKAAELLSAWKEADR
jgi:creatinine amidohydrolase/Fe(II)-dependent formamide hydrolase-like protein